MRASLVPIAAAPAAACGVVRDLRLGGGGNRPTVGRDGTSLGRVPCPAKAR